MADVWVSVTSALAVSALNWLISTDRVPATSGHNNDRTKCDMATPMPAVRKSTILVQKVLRTNVVGHDTFQELKITASLTIYNSLTIIYGGEMMTSLHNISPHIRRITDSIDIRMLPVDVGKGICSVQCRTSQLTITPGTLSKMSPDQLSTVIFHEPAKRSIRYHQTTQFAIPCHPLPSLSILEGSCWPQRKSPSVFLLSEGNGVVFFQTCTPLSMIKDGSQISWFPSGRFHPSLSKFGVSNIGMQSIAIHCNPARHPAFTTR